MYLCCFDTEDIKTIEKKKLLDISKTGDLILWKGTGIFSCIINLTIASSITHVGMVVRFEKNSTIKIKGQNIVLDSSIPYFVHSIIEEVSDVNDVFTKKPKEGVQINKLSDVLNSESNTDKLYYRKLLNRNSFKLDHESLKRFILKNHSKSYEKNFFELVKSSNSSNSRENTNYYFCSELVAYMYESLGIDSKLNPIPNNITPLSFSEESEGWSEKYIFSQGFMLSDTYKIL